jgi:hypothetical protein
VENADIKSWGDQELFRMLAYTSSEAEGWMKSTKAMEIAGVGCVVQVTSIQRNPDGSYSIAEALTFVPGVQISEGTDGRVLYRAPSGASPPIFQPPEARNPTLPLARMLEAAEKIAIRTVFESIRGPMDDPSRLEDIWARHKETGSWAQTTQSARAACLAFLDAQIALGDSDDSIEVANGGDIASDWLRALRDQREKK